MLSKQNTHGLGISSKSPFAILTLLYPELLLSTQLSPVFGDTFSYSNNQHSGNSAVTYHRKISAETTNSVKDSCLFLMRDTQLSLL